MQTNMWGQHIYVTTTGCHFLLAHFLYRHNPLNRPPTFTTE